MTIKLDGNNFKIGLQIPDPVLRKKIVNNAQNMDMLHKVSPSRETDNCIKVGADGYSRSLSMHIFIYMCKI